MVIAALFTTAKIQKQPSIHQYKWIRKMCYMHNGLVLIHLKELNFAICSNMDRLKEHYAHQVK